MAKSKKNTCWMEVSFLLHFPLYCLHNGSCSFISAKETSEESQSWQKLLKGRTYGNAGDHRDFYTYPRSHSCSNLEKFLFTSKGMFGNTLLS